MTPHETIEPPSSRSSSFDERVAIFRETAVDRLASPDDLDDLMVVVSARAWLAVCALGLLLAGAFGWAIFGRVEIRVPAHGRLLATAGDPSADEATRENETVRAELFVPVAHIVEIEPGMDVRMALRGFSPNRHGFLLGQVRHIDPRPHSETISGTTTTAATDAPARPETAYLRLDVALDDGGDEGYRWTSGSRPLPRLSPPIDVEATIAVRSEQPIRRLFPWLDEVAR
ncbi:MAG: hypothetical protein AAGE94_10240 [Acidobacteriota bacterium]